MERQQKLYKPIFWVVLVTILLLMIPLVAMQFTKEVDWSIPDFIVIGGLLFSAGLSYVLLTRYASGIIYRAAIASAIGTTLLMIWANLAVGLIGSGPNPGNLMYIGVVMVVVIGILRSRLTPRGMELAMFATVLALVLLVVLALLTNMHKYPGSSMADVIGVNLFFATLFAISGLMFRYISNNQASA